MHKPSIEPPTTRPIVSPVAIDAIMKPTHPIAPPAVPPASPSTRFMFGMKRDSPVPERPPSKAHAKMRMRQLKMKSLCGAKKNNT